MPPLPDSTPPPPDALIGTTLRGKWRLDRLIGSGGMAVVYAASHRNGRRVAVKLLTSPEPLLRDRFLREGLVANTVGHPGAVQVYDEDTTEDGAAFLVMELLEGEPLDALLERRGGRLPPLTVLRLADQLLDVLAAAHARGIVHRDIKPQNLFLTRDGILKVLDFGVARLQQRLSDDDSADTQTGVILGTVTYMAPEQASAQRERIDGRSDLWSVGATMFRMLTGRVVHEAETDVARLLAAISRPAPSLATIMPWLAGPVVSVVDRALAFTPEHRWPDARTMQCAVRLALGWLAHGPEARAHSAPEITSGNLPLGEATTSARISRPSFHSMPAAVQSVKSAAPGQVNHQGIDLRPVLLTALWTVTAAALMLAVALLVVGPTATAQVSAARRGVAEAVGSAMPAPLRNPAKHPSQNAAKSP